MQYKNAYIKTKAYYDETKITTIGMDNDLFMDSISIMPECNKYFVDLTDEDRNKNKANYRKDNVINFIVNNV